MPCNDTTSSITAKVGRDEELVDYQYKKISCGKTIGGRKGYINFCRGKNIESIVEIPFFEALNHCRVESSEDEFLLYLEWKALREVLRQYIGIESDADNYKIAEIVAEGGLTTIEMIIGPLEDMPPIIPCGS